MHRRIWLCWCVLEGHVSACLRGRARGGIFLLLSKPILPRLESYSPAVTAPMIILVITKLLCMTWKFNFLVESYRELSLFRAKNPWTSQKKKSKYQIQPLASRFSWKIKKAPAHFLTLPLEIALDPFFSTPTLQQSGWEDTSNPWEMSNSFQFIPWLWFSFLHCLKNYNSINYFFSSCLDGQDPDDIYWVFTMCQAHTFACFNSWNPPILKIKKLRHREDK